MSIALIPLSEADPASVRRLLAEVWECDWSDQLEDYLAWRFGRRESGETLVASAGGQCVGILDSFIRPYLIDGRRQSVRETCDWYCLPQYRAVGVGLHLMRRMMSRPEPILVIGGTQATLDLLPRLKWVRLVNVDRFALAVSAKTTAGLVAQRLGRYGGAFARIVPNIRLVYRLRRTPPPSANAEVREGAFGAAEGLAANSPYDFAPWLDGSILDWLAIAPKAVGEFALLSFFDNGVPVGLTISRLQTLAIGCKAQLVHVQTARLELIDWIVGATVRHLIDRGAGLVSCDTSCPATCRALRALGFLRWQTIASHWWHADSLAPSGLFNLTSLSADNAIRLA
jgi:Acetyltransferase (GNAT) family